MACVLARTCAASEQKGRPNKQEQTESETKGRVLQPALRWRVIVRARVRVCVCVCVRVRARLCVCCVSAAPSLLISAPCHGMPCFVFWSFEALSGFIQNAMLQQVVRVRDETANHLYQSYRFSINK